MPLRITINRGPGREVTYALPDHGGVLALPDTVVHVERASAARLLGEYYRDHPALDDVSDEAVIAAYNRGTGG